MDGLEQEEITWQTQSFYVWEVPVNGSPLGRGSLSLCLWRRIDSVVEPSSHRNISGKLCSAWQTLKSEPGKDHINFNTASKKIVQLMMSRIYSAPWHVFQPSNVPLSKGLRPGDSGI